MSGDLKEFLLLKEKLEKERSQAERAKGALEQLRQALYKSFSEKDLEGARKKLKALEEEHSEVDQKITFLLEKFNKKYQGRLS